MGELLEHLADPPRAASSLRTSAVGGRWPSTLPLALCESQNVERVIIRKLTRERIAATPPWRSSCHAPCCTASGPRCSRAIASGPSLPAPRVLVGRGEPRLREPCADPRSGVQSSALPCTGLITSRVWFVAWSALRWAIGGRRAARRAKGWFKIVGVPYILMEGVPPRFREQKAEHESQFCACKPSGLEDLAVTALELGDHLRSTCGDFNTLPYSRRLIDQSGGAQSSAKLRPPAESRFSLPARWSPPFISRNRHIVTLRTPYNSATTPFLTPTKSLNTARLALTSRLSRSTKMSLIPERVE